MPLIRSRNQKFKVDLEHKTALDPASLFLKISSGDHNSPTVSYNRLTRVVIR